MFFRLVRHFPRMPSSLWGWFSTYHGGIMDGFLSEYGTKTPSFGIPPGS